MSYNNVYNETLSMHPLRAVEIDALLAFYHSLSQNVVTMFQPFGPEVKRPSLLAHLQSAEAGRDISLGLVRMGGSVAGHAFVLMPEGRKPVFGIGLAEFVQGRGWGKALAKAVLAEADKRKISLVSLTVLKNNIRAKTMYEKLGFALQGEESFQQSNDSYYMERFCCDLQTP